MRRWRSLAVILAVTACNSIAGTGKYTICADDTCGATTGADASAGADGSSGGDGSGDDGSSGGVQCNASGTPIPKCSEGELDNNIETAADAPRVIQAPNSESESPYVPNCMIIKAGQSVTWQGDLTHHPLTNREDSTEPNPIVPTSAGVTTVTYTFPCPGDYNFSCRIHRDAMLGTIRVLP